MPTPVNDAWLIYQGADNSKSFRPYRLVADVVTYYDLTEVGWSARAQIRARVGGTEWVEFLSTETTGARIDLDADGWVSLVLPAAVTEATAWNGYKKGKYDVELIDPDGGVIRLAEGDVEVSHDVTREA